MSLVLFVLYTIHSFVSRDYLNLEPRHHHDVVLYRLFIIIFFCFYCLTAAKVHKLLETPNKK